MTTSALSLLNQQLDALLTDERDTIANLANASALLKQTVPDLNWAGFYLYDDNKDELVLGPFQGNVACMHIKIGRGVCGTAYAEQSTQRIANVHAFADHIACDAASNAELVIPLTKDNVQFGVLDLDSPTLNRFTEADQKELETFAGVLMSHLDITR
ncbi:GAF domain-containing protein [Furfurilactobacillus siliginis]|uniref:Sensor histidine kinase n=1 Tax=Furfurilactobacillus siliginis TaxID=348151 RepID=A0A0R2L1A9_9LACO|nr:GAF domain-containing protein [Furfurilactobacillus siliginis]KRN95491.1 signaling protein containing gaf domain [Furfurilactobacillus siliginis]GEK29513.1 sensor histidine kinase [Furfurilactobacillus siliginis]